MCAQLTYGQGRMQKKYMWIRKKRVFQSDRCWNCETARKREKKGNFCSVARYITQWTISIMWIGQTNGTIKMIWCERSTIGYRWFCVCSDRLRCMATGRGHKHDDAHAFMQLLGGNFVVSFTWTRCCFSGTGSPSTARHPIDVAGWLTGCLLVCMDAVFVPFEQRKMRYGVCNKRC